MSVWLLLVRTLAILNFYFPFGVDGGGGGGGLCQCNNIDVPIDAAPSIVDHCTAVAY